jgi:hypothetical protein
MLNKKLLISIFLVMVIAGFTMSSVSAESTTYTTNAKVGDSFGLQEFDEIYF